jgi:hypothetical protein
MRTTWGLKANRMRTEAAFAFCSVSLSMGPIPDYDALGVYWGTSHWPVFDLSLFRIGFQIIFN